MKKEIPAPLLIGAGALLLLLVAFFAYRVLNPPPVFRGGGTGTEAAGTGQPGKGNRGGLGAAPSID